MRKPLGIQKCDGPTDLPTYRPTDLPTDTARCRVACPRLITITECVKSVCRQLVNGRPVDEGTNMI